MRVSKRAGAVAFCVAVALVAAGCSSNNNGGTSTTNNDKTANGTITIGLGQPENGLVPANTSETNGGLIVDNLFTGLVGYANGTGKPYNLLADSITTTDSQHYTIKIKQNTKFHDGTIVKAKNFVDAWNFAALQTNAMTNGSFFDDIQGYSDVAPGEGKTPTAQTMSGLKVVDDWTFDVTLGAPFSIFPTKLGYSAFKPLPDVFFTEGAQKFGRNPIGNGPLKFVSWTDNVEIKLTRFDDYSLPNKVKVKNVTMKMYQDQDAEYNDLLSNVIDFQQQVPSTDLAGDKWKSDLGDRAKTAPVPTTGIISFPIYDKRFQNPKLRQAISLAIDRDSINQKIFFGTRPPATTWSNPLAPGGGANDCTVCKYDPTTAKQLLAAAGGWTGKMTLFYNADGGHKAWMDAVAQSIKNTLGIDCVAEGIATFAVIRQQIQAHKMTGPFRAAWQEDYPDVEDWLVPLYKTGGSSNDGLYSNPAVDQLITAGTSSANVDDAHAKFAEATKLIDQDVPAIPIYTYSQQWGTSTKVKNVQVTWAGEPDLSSFEIA